MPEQNCGSRHSANLPRKWTCLLQANTCWKRCSSSTIDLKLASLFHVSPPSGERSGQQLDWANRSIGGESTGQAPVFAAAGSAGCGSDPAALQLKRFPNSVDTLAPNNRFVMAIDRLPIAPGIPYYSIVGDRGRGDTPNSSDGVVAYWSSHLDGAKNEFIAPCNHSSPRNPQAIAEVHRILKIGVASN